MPYNSEIAHILEERITSTPSLHPASDGFLFGLIFDPKVEGYMFSKILGCLRNTWCSNPDIMTNNSDHISTSSAQ
jgi:hypothetical protein